MKIKLKALPPRLYNAIFHTHTVSGIVIGFALFVCFYAGATALFLDEVYRWENPMARFETPAEVDFDRALQAIKESQENFAINESFSLIPPDEMNPFILFFGAVHTEEAGKTERFRTYIHPITYEVTPYEEPTTHMGRTLYELHFFHQIPVIGIYLAGLVAFFFLFAIITGVMIHWKNLLNKFNAFTVKGKWKQIWTNGHTVLGVITLPFQAIYAITGALLGLSILLLAPSAFLLFDGDTNEIVKTVRPDLSYTYEETSPDLTTPHRFNQVYEDILTAYPEHQVRVMFSSHYGKEDGTISVRIDDFKGIAADATMVYASKDGALLSEEIPNNKSYAVGVYPILIKLHYATYGGIFLKIIYFILAMLTCFIISSGVMIWQTVRDNPRYTDQQRRFHFQVTRWYLGITNGLFPAVALIFLANKAVPIDWVDRTLYVNGIFFIGWLLLAISSLLWKNLNQLIRNYLTLGGIMGLLIPIANGIFTGDWIWQTFMAGQWYVFSVDLTWLITGSTALMLSLQVLPNRASLAKASVTNRTPTLQLQSQRS
ncbi:MAG: PepSY-associated TM helix domain-containing protein [Bacteroidota bacterium]